MKVSNTTHIFFVERMIVTLQLFSKIEHYKKYQFSVKLTTSTFIYNKDEIKWEWWHDLQSQSSATKYDIVTERNYVVINSNSGKLLTLFGQVILSNKINEEYSVK